MALSIRIVSGAEAGREIEIGDDLDEVKFGRASDSDVGFPAELDIVSRDHFRLRRELGVYKFVISREKPVFANGRPILDGEELDRVMEVQLSGPDGPRLRIERHAGADGNLPKTKVLKGGQDIGDFAQATRTGSRRLATGLGVGAVLLALVAGGYFLLRGDLAATQDQLALVKTELPAIKADAAAANQAAASRMDTAAIISKAHDSVYHVQVLLPDGVRFEGGTASVVLLPDGTKALATNAHVADIMNDVTKDPLMRGGKVLVVQPRGPDYQVHEVLSVTKHPGYDVFEAWAERAYKNFAALAGGKFTPLPAYDVAILNVSEPEKLGAPLTYASRETMLALKQGEPLMTLGYASEGLAGTDITRPEPTAQYGVITALTTFYLYRSDTKDNQLVQHSAPGAGGASGSPMFNAKGEVVAFYNAGNNAAVMTEDGARVPSAAQVNYAIRADLLLDLVEGKAEALMPQYQAEMAAEEKRLERTPDQIVTEITGMFGRALGDPDAPQTLKDAEVVMDQGWPGGPTNGRVASVEASLPDVAYYVVLAISLDRRPIQALLVNAEGEVLSGGADFAHVSVFMHEVWEPNEAKLKIGVFDLSSTGDAAVEPGKVRLVILKGVPKPEEEPS